MINVLADQYLYNIQSYLPGSINLTLFDPSEGLPPQAGSAHGLLIRTVTPVNRRTLPYISEDLTFIGTATAGTDHIDTEYLRENGIALADAAGCNARSVAEYVAAALLLWTEKRGRDLTELTVGLIGAGNAGCRVNELLQNLGCSTVAFDPPREERDSNFKSASLEQVLDGDILSFHTPLTKTGDYPTYHWLDSEKLSAFSFQLVINTARGGVIDERALGKAFDDGRVDDFILDVWEHEPDLDLKSAGRAFIKTPHIAGYSVEAKENASRLAAQALLDHFDIPKPDPRPNRQKITFDEPVSNFETLSSLLIALHPIRKYEAELQKIMDDHSEERGERFNKLRAEFPLRNEFRNICLTDAYFKKFPVLEKLGFSGSRL